jgi:hypothetical protein
MNAELKARAAETLERLRPSWSRALRWTGYVGFFLFVILPTLLLIKIVLKILLLLVAW